MKKVLSSILPVALLTVVTVGLFMPSTGCALLDLCPCGEDPTPTPTVVAPTATPTVVAPTATATPAVSVTPTVTATPAVTPTVQPT